MFLAIAERFNVSLERAPAVGDSLRDLQAAVSAGARPILVLTGKGERRARREDCRKGRRSILTSQP
jgi:D-glycero-D-manno-heptose 1,7-bisphosphate phosphatase